MRQPPGTFSSARTTVTGKMALLGSAEHNKELSQFNQEFILDIIGIQSTTPSALSLPDSPMFSHSSSSEGEPRSLLYHCMRFKHGLVKGNVPIMEKARDSIAVLCYVSCSSSKKPVALCQAISYTYQNMPKEARLVEILTEYCAKCFLKHHLDRDDDFKKLVKDLKPFQFQLARFTMNSRKEMVDNQSKNIGIVPRAGSCR